MTVELPKEQIPDRKEPLWDLNPKRVNTAEVLMRVMAQDNRHIQDYLGRTKSTSPLDSADGFGGWLNPTVIMGLIAAGPAMYGIYKMLKSRTEEAANEEPVVSQEPEAEAKLELKPDPEPTKSEKKEQTVTAKPVAPAPISEDTPKKETPAETFFERIFGKKPAPEKEAAPKPIKSSAAVKLHKDVVADHKIKESTKTLAKPSADVDQALRKVADKHNVDYATIYALAGAESSFRHGVTASTSSAAGLMQHTDKTWNYLTKEVFPELGYTSKDRLNPEKSATVAVLYLSRIKNHLANALGRMPSLGELYTGYFLGPTGAAKFLLALQKDPDQIGARLFPSAAKANKNLFYDGGKPVSLLETYNRINKKITRYYVAGKQNETTLAAAQEPTQVSATPVANTVSEARPVKTAVATPQPVAISLTESGPAEDEIVVAQAEESEEASTMPLVMTPRRNPTNVTLFRDKNHRLVAIPS